MLIRSLSQGDLMDIDRIQRECYSEDILESIDSFSAKLSADSDFSFMAMQGEFATGYVVALPWVYGELLDLNGIEYSIPPDSDSVCIHDIAVSKKGRNVGTAKHLLNAVLDTARSKGYNRFFLIAVQGASSYWARNGFEVVPVNNKIKHRLSAYGQGATYMTKTYRDA